MANMTAVKKRLKGGAGQSSTETEDGNKKAGSSEVTTEVQTGLTADGVSEKRITKDSLIVSSKITGNRAGSSPVPVPTQAPAEDEQLLVVREYVSRAAQILQSLGTEYERIAWLLEDTLSYLEDADEDEEMAFERIKIEEL